MQENPKPSGSTFPADIRSAITRTSGLENAIKLAKRGPNAQQKTEENEVTSGQRETPIITPTFRPDQTLIEISSPPAKMGNDEKTGTSLQEIIRRATGREQTPPEGNTGR